MAETNKKKKTPAQNAGASAKKSSTSAAKKNGKGSENTTAAAKAPAKKKQSTGSKPAGKDEAQVAARIKRRSTFSEQFLPYIFAGLALIFTVFLVLNVFVGANTPSDHPAGFIGYYFCQILFGCFGWAAYLIPLIFVNLAIFWRRYCDENLVAVKVILSMLLMVMISSVIHVAVCTKNPDLAQVYDIGHLYRTGYAFESGGIVGGLVGYALYAGLKLSGTVALAVVSLPLIVMLLVGVTPAYVFSKLWAIIRARREIAAERRESRRAEREARREELAAEAEAKRKAEVAETYRQKREKLEAERRLTEEAPLVQEETTEVAPVLAPTPDTTSRKKGRRYAMVDTETGETVEEFVTTSDENEVPELPLYEPSLENEVIPTEDERHYDSAEVDWNDSEIGDGFVNKVFAEQDVVDRKKHVVPTTPPVETELADDRQADFYDDTTDTMDTDLEEEADVVTVDVTPTEEETDTPENSTTGNYAFVYSAEEKPADSVVVTINRQEFTAVTESGLSEEEMVLSTAHATDDLPATPAKEYQFPSVDMLTRGSARYEANDEEIAENTRLLRDVLESFHIRVKEISCSCGPTITRFEVKPDTGIRVRSIANLVDDIAMNLAKAGVRIEAPIPGKAAVGIEVPNAEPATVYFRNILETPEFRNHKSRIAACLGADVSGRPVILDINKMPHLLIAGATGMGKSVCINSIIMSILYKAKPDEVKLILIDPKKVEFSMYRELPHLLCPIVSDPKQAAGTLYCAVNEMERRFGLIEEVGVRNLAGYNEITAGDPERPAMPQIVIIIDELADLMMTAPADVETAICRLAQKARAAGIHLVIGTQRPSVDVITGLIKANIPSRIAFTVASAVDSRTIIDTVGADKLIGRGDMLYAPVGVNKPMRCQGTFVSESEVERVVTFIKENNEPVVYDEEFIKNIAVEAARCGVNKKKGEQVSIDDFDGLDDGQNLWGEEPKFWEALEVIVSKEKIGTSALQRAIKLGYGRAAGIIDRMEEYGFVGPDPGNKTGRDVRITHEQYLDYKANGLPGHRRESGDDLFED